MSGPEHTQRATSPDAPPPNILAAYLADRDVPCPSCGYNLRELRTPRCPECGVQLTLRLLQQASTWRGRSLIRLAAIFVPIPLVGLLSILTIRAENRTGDGQAALGILFVWIIGLVLAGVALPAIAGEVWHLMRRARMPSPALRVHSWIASLLIIGAGAFLGWALWLM